MPLYRQALEYYCLDGWVTEHVNILMEMSNLYRSLAGFEPDSARRAAMNLQRIKLLAPLSGDLSPDHYLGLIRSIDLEVANAYRDVMVEREDQAEGLELQRVPVGGGGVRIPVNPDAVKGRSKSGKTSSKTATTAPPTSTYENVVKKTLGEEERKAQVQLLKLATDAAKKATAFYVRFLNTYLDQTGRLPINAPLPEGSENHVLSAAFNVGRLVRKSSSAVQQPFVPSSSSSSSSSSTTPTTTHTHLELSTTQKEADKDLGRALRLLTWAADYTEKYKVESFRKEAELAKEMVSLMIEHRRRLGALQANGIRI
eukprot:CAMPEP_0175042616 /NCGR_PEP_ID=MMETSP0052_2-20121109/2680_1 /TAXON_ID=51329 ORGANISM="Polytomella parva, Strain SAG 63-3" /NCGR_SAMPLE_ID=MMETSP0052_2 /ASSEMBLY_ACC=CAM_ASM_000194 /LENGTH=312 /DNA_ID=CAMNT_0016305483 /DNA_START=219 /DNA_END=1157 /DNA_ORIENTATION=+